ncbi:MAG: hypothetical protein RIR11_4716 [Bacteroidota bacterium]|jgi:hypothetical protein
MEKQILAVLFILPLFLHGQNKWEINVAGYQNYVINPVIRDNNRGVLGGMLGGHYHLHIKKKIFFVTGLEFLQFGYQRKGDFSQLPSENVNGQYVRDPLLDDEFKDQRYFFQIPFELRVQFPQKKVAPFIQGGMIQSFLLGYRSKSKFAGRETKTSKLTPFDQNALGARLSFGFGVPLSNHTSLTIAAFAYSGIQYFDNQFKYRAFGLNLGYLFGRS